MLDLFIDRMLNLSSGKLVTYTRSYYRKENAAFLSHELNPKLT